MSYQGIVTKITNIQNHPNADKLNIGKACNFSVIISKDIQEGTLGVFFQEGGVLSIPFLRENNLYRHKHLNKDAEKEGLFDDSGRIRAIRLRGVASEGIWLPLNSLEFTGIKLEELKEDLMFNAINGVEVCTKYVTKKTREAGAQNAPKQKKRSLKEIYPQFAEHFDTQQLKYFVHHIPKGAVLSITEKLHGTSGRTGLLLKAPDYLLTEKPVPDFKGLNLFKSPRRFFAKVTEYVTSYKNWVSDSKKAKNYNPNKHDVWDYVTGTRRVILNLRDMKDTFYKDCDFRTVIHNKLSKLNNFIVRGMTLYYEIVGYTDTKSPIMGSHGVKKEMKELKAQYGDIITYSYGCNVEEAEPYAIYIYRITITTEDGRVYDLPYYQLVNECKNLELQYVPVLKEPFIYDGNAEALLKMCEELSNGPSTLDSRHLREGVVLKVEYPGYEKSYKFKSFDFLVMEGIVKDNENFVDEEEAQSEN
jgi:hypothetical protein